MPRPFLEVFPREIRDHIYTYVLASPSTGAVTLSPWTVEVARSLWLMRTCRQIHRECKDLIWHANRLHLLASTQLCEKLRAREGYKHIQQLKMSLEILDRDELEWFLKSTPALVEWCQKGKLATITLATSFSRPNGLNEFREIMNLRKHGESLDGRLYLEKTTWTRMTVTTGWPRFSHWGKQRWLKEMLLDPTGITELLREIHMVFGGKLYIDGLLFFHNHRQVYPPHFDPRNGEIRIEPHVGPVIQTRKVSFDPRTEDIKIGPPT